MCKDTTRLAFLMVFLALVAAVPSTQQACARPTWNGGVKIVNNLDINLYVRSVFFNDGPVQIVSGNGGHYSEVWRPSDAGTGVSVKISTQNNEHDVLQFEYSATDPVIYWDVSCINLSHKSRFFEEGFAAIPTSPDCSPVICRPGVRPCPDVFFKPDDYYAVRGCEINTWVILHIGTR